MKNKGIVKIDEVGRIVIPKNIRNMLELKDKLVEVFVENDRIIIQKFAPLYLNSEMVKSLCKKIELLTGYPCIAGDYEKIIYASASSLSFLEGKQISMALKSKLGEQGVVIIKENAIIEKDDFKCKGLCLTPINNSVDGVIGFFGLISLDENDFDDKDIYSLKIAKELFSSVINRENGR